MYRYTEKIGDLTRTYEAESPEKVVELVLAVTMDIQPEIDKRCLERQQLTNVNLAKLEQLVKTEIAESPEPE